MDVQAEYVLRPKPGIFTVQTRNKSIIRWGESDEIWLKNGDNPEVQAAEQELKERLSDTQGLTLNQIWEKMNSCGRNPGTFREPVYILKEKGGFTDWIAETVDKKQAIKHIVEKLIASFGITDPVHIIFHIYPDIKLQMFCRFLKNWNPRIK